MAANLIEIAGMRVLFAMAAEQEYGPALQARFAPLWTGVGPVEAALNTAAALRETRPDLLVSLGSAGSRVLTQGAVYQASSISYRDMDASAFGFEKGCTPFLDLPAEIPMPHQIPGLPAARLSTGAAVISGAGYDAIAQEMVDMESFAILRACQRAGVPMIGLRGISDGAAEISQFTDWTEYLGVIDLRLAKAVDQLEAALRSGAITFSR